MKKYALLVLIVGGCALEPTESLEQAATINPGPGSIPLTDAEPVRLLSSALQPQGCSSCNAFSGGVELKNIAFEKNVNVFYGCPVAEASPEGEWTWRTTSAGYSHTLPDGIEVWGFWQPQPGCYKTLRFAIRYQVAGNTYWDNNCGWNYRIEVPAGSSTAGTSGRAHSCL